MTIHVATPADYDRLAPIVSTIESSPVTGEDLRDRDVRDVGSVSLRLFAEDYGEVVGYGRVVDSALREKGYFWLPLVVAPSHRGRGIARQMVDRLECFAGTQGATSIEGQIRDNDSDSVSIAKHFGYEAVRHEFESALDVRSFEPSQFMDVVRRLESEGLRFVSLAETGQSEENQRMLHAINVTVSRDIPGIPSDFNWPYEHFCRSVFDAKWFRPEGQIMAMDGDTAVGLGAVGEVSPGRFYNAVTGVRRDYRGRGIATALKVLTTLAAKDLGGVELFTNNDSDNLAMLAINEKLGYVRRPGLIKVRKLVA